MTTPRVMGGYSVAAVKGEANPQIKIAAIVVPYRLGPDTTLEPLVKGSYAIAIVKPPPSENVLVNLSAMVCLCKEFKLPIILTPLGLGQFLQTLPYMAEQ